MGLFLRSDSGRGWEFRMLAMEALEQGAISKDHLARDSWERIARAYHDLAELLDRKL